MAISEPPDNPAPLEPSDDDAPEPRLSAENAYAITTAYNEAYIGFIERNWRRLVDFARLGLNAGEDGEDRVQEAVFSGWMHKVAEICKGGEDCIGNYMFNILRATVTDAHRRGKSDRYREALAEFFASVAERMRGRSSPSKYLKALELHEDLVSAIRELPRRCREVFVLVRVYDMKYAEAAAALQMKPGSVGPHLKRADRQMSEKLIARGYDPRTHRKHDEEEEDTP